MQLEHGGDRGEDVSGVTERSQLYQPDAIPEFGELVHCQLERQSRLTSAAWTDEGKQSGRVQESTHVLHLAFPPDETGQGRRKIVRQRIQRIERRKLTEEIGRKNLKEMLLTVQITQTVLTKIQQPDTWRQMLARQFCCDRGEKYLSSMPRGHNARCPVERLSVIVARTKLRFTTMQTHSHPDL